MKKSRLYCARVHAVRCYYCTSSSQDKIIRKHQPALKKSILFVSPVWPERTSSAAGVRTFDLVESCRKSDTWGPISYASISSRNGHSRLLDDMEVNTYCCKPNKADEFMEILDEVRPNVVVFDRWFTEEMFSFLVHKYEKTIQKHVLRILDMQDVHFLRNARQALVHAHAQIPVDALLNCRPNTPETLRELAAVQRSDLTLVCSPVEIEMLANTYQINRSKLENASFFCPPLVQHQPPFEERDHLMMIGNFKHPPNADSVLWSCKVLWPKLREKFRRHFHGHLPELHIYGAYPSVQFEQLHSPNLGIHFKGFAPSLEIMSSYRVLFAPLRFGAGLKGKIVDAWQYGLPVSTTPIGAEGMASRQAPDRWGGAYHAWDPDEIVDQTFSLYTDSQSWEKSQKDGFYILKTEYNAEKNISAIHQRVESMLDESVLEDKRSKDYIGQMLWSQQFRATEYFSRYIELKESTTNRKQ